MKPSDSPRVLCVSSFFHDHGGGVERVAHQLATHLAGIHGWDVTLAAHLSGSPVPRDTGYQVFGIPCWNGLEARTGLPLMLPHPGALLKTLRTSRRADLVVVHDVIYLTNLLVILWCLLFRKPVVVIKHSGMLQFPSRFLLAVQAGLTACLFRPILRLCALTVFVTETKQHRYDPKRRIARAMVIENGTDTGFFQPGPLAERSQTQLCFIGRFIDRKGLATIHELAKVMPTVPFVLVGWGTDDPRTWGLANVTVHWNPDRALIAEVYRKSRLTLFPGVSEGVELVVIESLASGTPVLANTDCVTTNPDLKKALHYEASDITRPSDTARAWKLRIESILSEPLRQETVDRVAGLARRDYSSSAVYDKYYHAFRKILDREGKAT